MSYLRTPLETASIQRAFHSFVCGITTLVRLRDLLTTDFHSLTVLLYSGAGARIVGLVSKPRILWFESHPQQRLSKERRLCHLHYLILFVLFVGLVSNSNKYLFVFLLGNIVLPNSVHSFISPVHHMSTCYPQFQLT